MSNENTTPEQTPADVESVEQELDQEQAAESVAEEQQDAAAQKIAELELALTQLQGKYDAQSDGVMRARAESENIRRRAQQDVEKAHKFALEKFAAELLPVIDNLERAIDAADSENEAVKPLVEGVELTLKTFLSSTEKFGLAVIDPAGQPFDPDKHQAIGMQESNDHKPNHVMAVLQKGYDLNSRVIRPAMVMVAKAASESAPSVDTEA